MPHGGGGRGNFFCFLFVLYPYFFVLTVLAFEVCPYCTTHPTQTFIPLAGFKPATPASDRPQVQPSDRVAVTGIGKTRRRDLPAYSAVLQASALPPALCR